MVLLCNMNPYGLTLTLLRKRPGRFLRIPLSPPQKYRTFVRYFFMWDGDSHDFIVVLLCNMNPCGLITNEERRKRVAFADIECSFIANKSDTKCPRKAQCKARFVERRRSEKRTSSLSSLLRKRPGHFLRIPSSSKRTQVKPCSFFYIDYS